MGVTLLLDTHVLVWAQSRPARLSAAARDLLEDSDNVILPEAVPMVARWTRALQSLGAHELGVGGEHAVLAGSMSWDHRDPFDRLLVAQAVLEDATLVMNDRAITSASTARVLW